MGALVVVLRTSALEHTGAVIMCLTFVTQTLTPKTGGLMTEWWLTKVHKRKYSLLCFAIC